jgi:hypothetical protein
MACWAAIWTTLCVWTAFLSLTSASLTVLDPPRHNLTFPTADYFETTFSPYALADATLIRLYPQTNFNATYRCRFKPLQQRATPSMMASSGVVGLINWKDAEDAGCHNYYHAIAKSMKLWTPSVDAAGLPEVKLLVIEAPLPYPGKPSKEPYLSHTWRLADSAPPLPTLLLYANHASELRTFMRNASVLEHVTIQEEAGPWNREYLSSQFLMYKRLHFGINAAMLLFSTYTLIRSTLLGLLRFDWRFFIFSCGYIATFAYAASLLLEEQTLVRSAMEVIKGIFFPFAFYALLLLWVNVLSVVPRPHVYIPMQLLACLGICATLLNSTTTLLRLFKIADSPVANAINIYLILFTQFTVALVFFIYGIQFQRRKVNATQVSNQYAYNALARLAWLAIVGSGANLILFCINLFDDRLLGKPTISFEVLLIMIRSFASTIRGGAILLILSVRLPESKRRPPAMQISDTSTFVRQLKSPPTTPDDEDGGDGYQQKE